MAETKTVYRCAVNRDTGEIMEETTLPAREYPANFTGDVYTGNIGPQNTPYRVGLSIESAEDARRKAKGEQP